MKQMFVNVMIVIWYWEIYETWAEHVKDRYLLMLKVHQWILAPCIKNAQYADFN